MGYYLTICTICTDLPGQMHSPQLHHPPLSQQKRRKPVPKPRKPRNQQCPPIQETVEQSSVTARLPQLPVECEDDKESHRVSSTEKPCEFGSLKHVTYYTCYLVFYYGERTYNMQTIHTDEVFNRTHCHGLIELSDVVVTLCSTLHTQQQYAQEPIP